MHNGQKHMESFVFTPIHSISSEDSHRSALNAQRSREAERVLPSTFHSGGLSDSRGQSQRTECPRTSARQLLRELPREEELPFLCPNFMSDTPQPSCRISGGYCCQGPMAEMGLCITLPDIEQSSSGRDSLDSCFDFNVREHLQERGLAPIIFPASDSGSSALSNGIELPSVWFSPSDRDISAQRQKSGKHGANNLGVSMPASKSFKVLRKGVPRSPCENLGRRLDFVRVVSGKGELERPLSTAPSKAIVKKSYSQPIRSNHLLESAEDPDYY